MFQLGLLIDNVQNKKNNKKKPFVKINDIESVLNYSFQVLKSLL